MRDYGTRQVILVTTRASINDDFSAQKVEKDNIFTLTWHMPCSFEPRMYAISVGKKRFSRQMIDNSGVFCVNFIKNTWEEKAKFCGSLSGKRVDKFKEAKLEKEECEKIDCPRLKKALASLECKVIRHIETGDHIIYIGQVINSKIKEEGKRLYQVEGEKFTTTK